MKVLPLWQPWATLVAIGAKRIETRHWPAGRHYPFGERIAIHATKGGMSKRDELALIEDPHFYAALRPLVDGGSPTNREIVEALPRGAIVATAVIDRSSQMSPASIEQLRNLHPAEHAFGHYEVGRYAWILRDVEALEHPVPFKARQGLSEIEDHLLRQGVLL